MSLVKNNLGFDSGLQIFQDKEMFNYSVDTIMLGNFVSLNSNVINILDIGANNGALSIFVASRKNNIKIDALEIQKPAADLCIKNVELNKFEKKISVLNDDFNNYYLEHCKKQMNKYDLIMCNPPFYKVGHFLERQTSDEILIARSEYKLNIEQIIKGASKIIKQKGYLTLIHKSERFVDIVIAMRKYGFEPKRIQFIYPRIHSKANFVMIEGRYRAGWGQHFLKNIYLHTEDTSKHEYNEETKKLYKPIKENDE